MRTAVIGLGVMGGAVAERLVMSGFDTLVYDIDGAAVRRLVAKGATACTIEGAGDADAIITSLPNDSYPAR